MSALLEVAVSCIARGWYVFPCKPRAKEPLIKGGFHAATNNGNQIEEWWGRWPDANVGIATGASGLTVLDIDTGLESSLELTILAGVAEMPKTYTVRTGRRPGFGVQLYFSGGDLRSIPWSYEQVSGDIRSGSGYVLAAGSIHPSGAAYEVLVDAPIAPTPPFVRELRSAVSNASLSGDEPIREHRNSALTSIAGKLRNAGLSAAALEAALLAVNQERCDPPMDDAEVSRIAANASKWALPENEAAVVVGKARDAATGQPDAAKADWRTRYMSETAFHNVQPPEFLLDGFLVRKSIAMLAGPVAQRKSIIALNIAHALCTGEPLFGYFGVVNQPERVVYLCPEMGAASFVKRIKQIGLAGYVGETLFVQTMTEKPTALDDLDDELPGAVVIVDTITRFIDGDENKSEDMRKFASKVFRLMTSGATVVLLHHSKKGSSGSLDDGLRGSSELAAFVDSCWVTELDDPKKPYEALSKMRNVKQRDFESEPFRLKPSPGSYFLAMDGEPEDEAVVKSRSDGAARESLRGLVSANPKMGVNKLCEALREAGHRKGAKWVLATRLELTGTGATLTG